MYTNRNMMRTVCVLAIAGMAAAATAQNQRPRAQQNDRRPQVQQQQDVTPRARGQNLNRLNNRAIDGVLCDRCGAEVQGQGQGLGQAQGQSRGLRDGTGGGPAVRGQGIGQGIGQGMGQPWQGPGTGLRNSPLAAPRRGIGGQSGLMPPIMAADPQMMQQRGFGPGAQRMMPQQPQRQRMVQPQRGQQLNQPQRGNRQGIGQRNPGQRNLGQRNLGQRNSAQRGPGQRGPSQRGPGQRGLGQQQGFGPQSGQMPPNARQRVLSAIRDRAAQMRGARKGQMKGQPMNTDDRPRRGNNQRGGQGQRGQGGRF